MRRSSSLRLGFTLVELLVVIAIIGVLVALLLPAVQAARESARMTQCKNNLKQMTLATLLHEETHGFYPTGGWGWDWIGDPDLGFGEGQHGGWLYSILPFMEQQAVWGLGQGVPVTSAVKLQANATRVTTIMPTINCPSRRAGVLMKRLYLPLYTDDVPFVARACYAINCGDSATNETGSFPHSMGEAATFAWSNFNYLTGISHQRSEITVGQVEDGTSNTYLIGEKYVPIPQYLDGGGPAENETALTGFNNDNFRNAYFPPRRDDFGGDRNGSYGNLDFGSAHSAGVNMSLCDGSVHLIYYSIDPKVHKQLANRRDGEIINRATTGIQ